MKRPLVALLLGLSAITAHAAVSDARVALEKGDYPAALSELNEHLRRLPDDANARFLRGLTLVLMDRDGEATQAFADLVRDHPELPEPYNNLAVLYARAGKYEQARDALETAIIKHPSYATAHENLGDVYATMAQAAWKRAQVLDRDNQAIADKLAQLSRALSGDVIVGDSSPQPRLSTERLEASAPRQPVAAPTAEAQVPAAAFVPPIMAPVVAPESGRTSAPSQAASNSAPVTAADRNAALQAVQAWAQAWSQQDVRAYLGAYSNRFDPGGGLSLDTWKQQRRARLTAPTSITVQVLNPVATALGNDTVRVRFVQIYQSNSYADQTLKEIDLVREDGGWRILREVLAP